MKNKSISFWELINKNRIEIPIIQRDYAQGRENEKKIRESFLKSLFDAFSNEETLELDFIYGDVKDETFLPLDGQQRLTTLFLLHWFIAFKEGKLNEENRKIFSKFSYETRASSREFCKSLSEKDLGNYENNKTVSGLIKNQIWFFKTWEKDPTIKAMLIMLDAIQAKFCSEDNFWENLTSENAKIKFHFIPLSKFGLSDDLYIKMNARGVQLSSFEDFKASFSKKIENGKWEENISLETSFSSKADNGWTDLFWHFSKENKSGFDSFYLNFIVNSVIFSLALSLAKREEIEGKVQKLMQNPSSLSIDDFDNISFDRLVKLLDLYSSKDDNDVFSNAKKETDLKHFLDNDTLFKKIISNEATYPQRVLFYAQTEYLLKNKFDETAFNNWMRIVRNITLNSTIDNSASFIGAILLIKELSEGCLDIYEYLKNNEIKSNFASEQVKEEKLKSHLINQYKSSIHEMEDAIFCKGKIDFSLYCIDYQDKKSVFDADKFSSIKEKIEANFNGEDISNEFRRGLLTIDDGNFYEYWGSWLYAIDASKRCLIKDTNDLKSYIYKHEEKWKKYVKGLLLKLLDKELNTIIADFQVPTEFPKWKELLIKDRQWLEKSHSHYIAINDEGCYIIPYSKVANSDEGRSKLTKVE